MGRYANTKNEISCIIAHLFQELDIPCNLCEKTQKSIIITGTTKKWY